MKKNPMNLAVVCDSKEQREHALQVAQQAGIAFGEWHCKTDEGNILRVYEDGYWIFWDFHGDADTTLTYDDFIEKYGQPQPDPIAKLTKRLEAVEQRVFGNSEQAQDEAEPQPEAVYDGVFWFDRDGANCMNGNHSIYYNRSLSNWAVLGCESKPKPHRLVPVEDFTVGKWYACEGLDLNGLFGYSMYLGDNRFVSWTMKEDYPILIHNQEKWRVQLLEVQPA